MQDTDLNVIAERMRQVLERDFGAQLLHGRRTARRNTCLTVQAGVPSQSKQPPRISSFGANTPTLGAHCASVTMNQTLWQSILMRVQHDVAPAEFATWQENTTLLDVDHARQMVVVGTPHVFVRDVVHYRYLPLLSAALSAQIHQSYAIHVADDNG